MFDMSGINGICYKSWHELQILMSYSLYMYVVFIHHLRLFCNLGLVWCMVLNATCNNISVVSWQSSQLMAETGLPGENHRPVASHC